MHDRHRTLPADVRIHACRRLRAHRSARVHRAASLRAGPRGAERRRALSLHHPDPRVAVLMSARGARNEGVTLEAGLRAAGISSVACRFDGESSLEEIERHVAALRRGDGRLRDRRRRRQVHRRGQGRGVSARHPGGDRADAGIERRALLGAVGAVLAGRRLERRRVLPAEARCSSSSTPTSSRPRRSATSSRAWATRWPPGTRRACAC